MDVADEEQTLNTESGAEPPAAQAQDAPAAAPEAEAEINALREQLVAAEDRALRVQAEAQNMIRRAERDVENARKFALERFVGALLPVIDNLERALAAMGEPTEATRALLEGVQLTHRSFLDVMQKFDVAVVDPAGEGFNPDLHQAMSIVEAPGATPNSVVAVMQKGYTLNGRLVRPAMVVVAKNASASHVDTTA
jgi:molecular chaperone GrpE